MRLRCPDSAWLNIVPYGRFLRRDMRPGNPIPSVGRKLHPPLWNLKHSGDLAVVAARASRRPQAFLRRSAAQSVATLGSARHIHDSATKALPDSPADFLG
jgi:hypothetical protein